MKKVALITGSKGGIGSAITSQLVNDGYRVIATYSTGNLQSAQDWFNTPTLRSPLLIWANMNSLALSSPSKTKQH